MFASLILLLTIEQLSCVPTTEPSQWSEWAEFYPNIKEEQAVFNRDFLFPDQLRQLQRVKKQLSSANRVAVPLGSEGRNQPVPINSFVPRGCGEEFCEDDPEYPDPLIIKEIVRNQTSEIEAAILFNQPVQDDVQVREKAAVPVSAHVDSRLRPGVVDVIQTEERTALLPDAEEGIVELNPKSTVEYVQETAVCASANSYVYPRSARNKKKEWRFVVNVQGTSKEDNFVQAVKVEKCLNNGGSCNIHSGLGGRTVCRQKYSYRKLMALSEQGEKYIDSFRFPSCCICYKQEAYGYSGLEFFRTQEKTAVLELPNQTDEPDEESFEQTLKDIEEQIEESKEEDTAAGAKKMPRTDRRRQKGRRQNQRN